MKPEGLLTDKIHNTHYICCVKFNLEKEMIDKISTSFKKGMKLQCKTFSLSESEGDVCQFNSTLIY